jgi:SSS family transporter
VVALTLLLYLAVLVAIGVASRRAAAGEEGFLLGGRSLGGAVAALGASASSSSAWTLLGVSGAAYAWGLSAAWLIVGCVGGFALNWLLVGPVVARAGRRAGALTAIDLVAGPRDAPGRRALVAGLALVVLVSLGAYVGAQLQGAGKTFEAVFGIPAWQSILGGAAVVLVYTWLGGFPAVATTDALQGTVMALAAVVLPVAAVGAAGGPAAIAEGLAAVGDPALLSPLGARPAPLGVGFVLGLLGIGLGYPGQPHVLKYFLALSDAPGALRRGRALALSWAAVVYVGMIALGLAGRALYPSLGDGEVVLVVAARDLLPPAVTGVVLAAVLSAMMSTADSQLFVAASTVTHDLRLGGGAGGTRVVVALLTSVAAVTATLGSESIFGRVLFGWAAMGASVGPLLVVRVWWRRRLSNASALAVVAVGALSAAGAHLFFLDLGGAPGLRGVMVHVLPYVLATGLALSLAGPPLGVDPELSPSRPRTGTG